ncbi:unnamed protein product [Cylicocyclus nassatus]|uniref:Uncharacterized protein n=1 Tax=Cylicocyclus nassatus TaxID=53992 RepID=A0AA36H1H8_CYLNA|nr:unnamed protein product [Cylicocyclus nassatus]
MKTSTAPGPDHLSVELLRAEGHRLHELHGPHPDGFQSNRSLPEVPTASRPNLRRLRERRNQRHPVSASRSRSGPSLREDINQLLQGLYNNDAAITSPPDHSNRKGVRQGDTTLTKLFTAALQWVMNWTGTREAYELMGDSCPTFVLRMTSFSSRTVSLKQKRC